VSGCPHFDLTDPETYQGGLPRDVFKYLRHEEPVYWHEDPAQGVGFWVITRQKDLDYVSKNPKLFSSAERSCLLNEMEGDQLAMVQTQLINMDPPRHLTYRRLVRAAFTPRMMDSYEARFREVARDLVDKAVADGRCEFVQDIAVDLPLIAICEIMGVPIERRQRRSSARLRQRDNPRKQAAARRRQAQQDPAPVRRVSPRGDEPALCQPADEAVDVRWLHGDQPAETVLR